MGLKHWKKTFSPYRPSCSNVKNSHSYLVSKNATKSLPYQYICSTRTTILCTLHPSFLFLFTSSKTCSLYVFRSCCFITRLFNPEIMSTKCYLKIVLLSQIPFFKRYLQFSPGTLDTSANSIM